MKRPEKKDNEGQSSLYNQASNSGYNEAIDDMHKWIDEAPSVAITVRNEIRGLPFWSLITKERQDEAVFDVVDIIDKAMREMLKGES